VEEGWDLALGMIVAVLFHFIGRAFLSTLR